MSGYAGYLLDIDLNNDTINKFALKSSFCKKYLGGIGFNARLLYELLPPHIDALSPDNIMIFTTGTLVCSPFPTASRTEASAKSPLTNRFATSNSGMFIGGILKEAGYDGIILRGKSAFPVYIEINNDEVKINKADQIWGKDTWDAIGILNSLHPGSEIALIGIAGENQVRFASLLNGRFDAWGRTGLGAVMGSKNVKAIVVKGDKGIKPADPQRFINVMRKAHKDLKSSPFFKPFKKYGTMNATVVYGKFNALAAHNFSKGTLPDWEQNFSRKLVDNLANGSIACQSCPIACAHWVELNQGKYKGLKIKDLEITPVVTFGAQCGLNPEATVKAAEICQRLGMDMVSAGSTAAMAIQLFKDGLLTGQDVGYSLDWGDEDNIFNLLYDIAGQKGIGKVLAQGTARAAKIIPGAESYAMHIKGLEIPMIDPRGRWSTWTFGMLTNLRGGDHLRCRNPVENLRYNKNSTDLMTEKFGFDINEYEQLDMPEQLKQQVINLDNDTVDIPQMSKWAEDLINLFNSLGVCIRPPVMNRIGPTILAEAYSSFTGLKVTAEDLMKASERIWNIIKLFNIREGENAGESIFPRRFYNEAINNKILDHNKIDQVISKYYTVRGWDPIKGEPTIAKLEELELNDHLVKGEFNGENRHN